MTVKDGKGKENRIVEAPLCHAQPFTNSLQPSAQVTCEQSINGKALTENYKVNLKFYK